MSIFVLWRGHLKSTIPRADRSWLCSRLYYWQNNQSQVTTTPKDFLRNSSLLPVLLLHLYLSFNCCLICFCICGCLLIAAWFAFAFVFVFNCCLICFCICIFLLIAAWFAFAFVFVFNLLSYLLFHFHLYLSLTFHSCKFWNPERQFFPWRPLSIRQD